MWFHKELNEEQAQYIAFLRAGPVMHSSRRIAELVHEKYPEIVSEELSGNQMVGVDLVRDAFFVIFKIRHMEAHSLAEKESKWQDILISWDL